MKQLLNVKSVSELKRDFYELTIEDTQTKEKKSIILCNPNIKEYCGENNISLKHYEYSPPSPGWEDLIGIIDSYISEGNYKYKMNDEK